MLRWRLASTRVWMLPSVTLPDVMRYLPSDQAGAVDELVEHGVDGGQHARCRLIPALVRQQVRHLLVEIHPGLRLPGGVHLLGHGRLDLRPAVRSRAATPPI